MPERSTTLDSLSKAGNVKTVMNHNYINQSNLLHLFAICIHALHPQSLSKPEKRTHELVLGMSIDEAEPRLWRAANQSQPEPSNIVHLRRKPNVT